ncbi:MAG: hypothetical protein J7L99_01735 [Planctomycetes bacterium]|nr:hypothetical protein [Planctomycetota bacterium]
MLWRCFDDEHPASVARFNPRHEGVRRWGLRQDVLPLPFVYVPDNYCPWDMICTNTGAEDAVACKVNEAAGGMMFSSAMPTVWKIFRAENWQD